MILAVGVALLVVVAVVIALAARRLRRPRVAVAVEFPQAESPEPALPEPEPEPVITWTAALTVTALDEAARLRLIDDLTLLAAPWTIALLRRAYQEESSPQLRARIEAALASTGEPIGTTSI
jgi:flagellar basal body-associated protein FliL